MYPPCPYEADPSVFLFVFEVVLALLDLQLDVVEYRLRNALRDEFGSEAVSAVKLEEEAD